MRIIDWSSDVCSSDLDRGRCLGQRGEHGALPRHAVERLDKGLDQHLAILAGAIARGIGARGPGIAAAKAERALLHLARSGDDRPAGGRADQLDPRRHALFLAAKAAERAEQRAADRHRSEEHTSELQSLMRISYAVFCLKKKKKHKHHIMNTKQP